MPRLGLIHERKGSGGRGCEEERGKGRRNDYTYTHGMIVWLREERKVGGSINMSQYEIEIRREKADLLITIILSPPQPNRKLNPN